VEQINCKFMDSGLGAIDETVFTWAFALVLNYRRTTAAELSLKTEELSQDWPEDANGEMPETLKRSAARPRSDVQAGASSHTYTRRLAQGLSHARMHRSGSTGYRHRLLHI